MDKEQAKKNYSYAVTKADRTYLRQTHEAWAKLMDDYHLAVACEEIEYRHAVAVAEEAYQRALKEEK